MKECHVVKYTDGSYMDVDDYGYYGKGRWQDAFIYKNRESADEFVETQKQNKKAFMKDPTGYVKGITPEDFDCKTVKWIITESE